MEIKWELIVVIIISALIQEGKYQLCAIFTAYLIVQSLLVCSPRVEVLPMSGWYVGCMDTVAYMRRPEWI